MALQPFREDRFYAEHGVPVDTTWCHCSDSHNSCIELGRKRGSCLCGQFLLVFCSSAAPVSGQTWVRVLTGKLKELEEPDAGGSIQTVTYRFWGSENTLRSGTNEGHLYKVVFEVWSSKDRKKIVDLIHGESVVLWYEQFNVSFRCHLSCCVNEFFTELDILRNSDVSKITFGVETVLGDVQELYDDCLNVCR